ncbi:MAG: hypothetical protein LLG42_00385 [Chloroflexi bacterium]|nr:hypothetical protein [Chloroflexota bacterium]
MGEKKESGWSAWIGWAGGIILLIMLLRNGGCTFSGDRYPFDTVGDERSEYYSDLADFEDDQPRYDPGLKYQDEIEIDSYNETLDAQNAKYSALESGCPSGCTIRPIGCDIKGNISYTTGEKIYHVPGGKYYSATEIDTASGERWFCTETEARDNGWRKSYD